MASAASVRRCRCRLLLVCAAAAAALLAATPSTFIAAAMPPPPPPPVSSSSSSSAAGAAAAAASNSPTNSAPPHGSNIYRDGLYAAFSALSNYTIMSELFREMDLSWMDSALPCTLLVVHDVPGLQKSFNVNNLGTLLAREFQIQLFPSHAFKMSDLLQMTAGGQRATVQTMMANRTVLVSRINNFNYVAAAGGGPVIFLDGVPILNPDAFVAPDGQLVAHGIFLSLPLTPPIDTGGNTGNAAAPPYSSSSFPLNIHTIILLPTILFLLF